MIHIKLDNCVKCGEPLVGLAATNLCDKHELEEISFLQKQRVIYEACLASAKDMGPEKIKQMSWFGKKHK